MKASDVFQIVDGLHSNRNRGWPTNVFFPFFYFISSFDEKSFCSTILGLTVTAAMILPTLYAQSAFENDPDDGAFALQ